MSNMLGRTRPFDIRTRGCCKKHGGHANMTPKRQKEDREWRRELEDDLPRLGRADC